MRKLFLTLAFCLGVLAVPALAQDAQPAPGDAPTLAELQIALWPEYDRPQVLVIYQGLFAPDTALPVPVEIRVPARVGQPSAVAYVDESGQLLNQPYSTRIEDDQVVVSFELPTLGFHLEYYDELAVDSTGMREYTYRYTADYPITALNMRFQVPPTAEGFTVEPAADSVVPESDGLTYHRARLGPLEKGSIQDWTLAYQKDDELLTAPGSAQTPAQTPANAAPSAESSDNTTVLIFLVAFVALVGVGAGAFWLGRRAQSIPESTPANRSKRRGSGRGSPSQPPRLALSDFEETPFCYKCGAELRHDAEFCHKCGAAVRRG